MDCKGVFIMTNLMSHDRMFPFVNTKMFDELMGEFFGKPSCWVGKEKPNYPMNVIRVIKNDEIVAYRLEYALAGFNKDDIKISVNGDVLKINVKMGFPNLLELKLNYCKEKYYFPT